MPPAAPFDRIPKTELHLHLRGAMPAEYFEAQLRRYRPEVALAEAPARHLELFRRQLHLVPLLEGRGSAADLFASATFESFLASYLFSSYFVRSAEDFHGLLEAVGVWLREQRYQYVEVTVSVIEYLAQGVPLEGLVEALDAAAESPSLELRWIVDLVRNVGAEQAMATLERLLARRPERWVGVTLGGSEHLFPPGLFRDCYARARAEGLGLTVHAGEGAGPESVWEALGELKVDRIGHGVRAIEDPRLVAELAERRIPLEICLTSNLRTGVYPSLEEHPLPRLLEAGVVVTLNTDDPSFFDTTLEQEFAAARRLGLTETQLEECARASLDSRFDRGSAPG